VQWAGTVEFADSAKIKDKEQYFVEFIHILPDKNLDQREIMVKVIVQFDEMLKQRLLSLKKGAIVTYQGKLPDSYVNLARLVDGRRLSLTDGRIVSP
jgi:hypothetical protein